MGAVLALAVAPACAGALAGAHSLACCYGGREPLDDCNPIIITELRILPSCEDEDDIIGVCLSVLSNNSIYHHQSLSTHQPGLPSDALLSEG